MDIAIVGIGCRFAGAPDLQSYWQLCRDGRDAFSPIPKDRWDNDAFYDTSRRATDATYARVGAFIDDIRTFPAVALGLPPRRVEVMDPQQRFCLEVCLQAIEDAGTVASALPRRTGVFMGLTAFELKNVMGARNLALQMASGAFGQPADDPEVFARAVERVVQPRPYSAPGVLGNMAAAIVAQELDLHGPAYTVDAACASALIAVADAVYQLRAGVIDAALAGGAYLQVGPDHYVAFSRIGAMSEQGKCLPFDARADGFVQGDGAGAVLLKRLDDAVRDGDRVYAVINGAAFNNDGRGDGPMAPVSAGQSEVIRDAWRDAGLEPSTLGYLETHGTGTDVGDASEVTCIKDALPEAREVWLGSSKANVGHTMSAAGIAGLIRAVLAIHHAEIPPMAGFRSSKPELGLDGSAFHVPTEARPWPGHRVAGVSSFGFGGTNAHAVLSAVPTPEAPVAQAELVLMSACDEAALRDLAGRTAAAIDADPTLTVAGLARAWSVRPAQSARLSVVARSREELAGKLRQVATGGRPAGTDIGTAGQPPKIAYLFPGQGSQRTGMLGDVRRRFPVVGDALAAMEAELAADLPLPLTHLLYPELRAVAVSEEQATAELTDTASCQPVLLAAAISLVRLLESVGVRPHVTTGHSLGEFTAAAVSGVLTPADAARFVARRGRAMAALPGDHGAMAAVMAGADDVRPLLVDGAVLANFNHPRQCVVSGTSAAVAAVVAAAEAADLRVVPLAVSHAFHSPVLADLDAAALLDGIPFADPVVPVASAIDAAAYRDAAHAKDVFTRHATSPVDFVGALAACRSAGADLYLQVGAGGPLASFAKGSLPRDHRGILTLASLDDADGGASLLETLGRLFVLGAPIDIRPITAAAAVASAPPTVLPREDYWPLKDAPVLPLNLGGVAKVLGRTLTPSEARPTPKVVAAPQAAPVAEAAPADDLVARTIGVIAKVSAYPKDALKPAMVLVDDLGFDSLMVGDLATNLAEAFPGLGGIPQELLINRPTVQDIVDFVKTSRGELAAGTSDDAPLLAYAPTWVPTPLSDLPVAPKPASRAWIVPGPSAVTSAIQAALSTAGHRVSLVQPGKPLPEGPVDVLVWCALADVLPVGAVLAGEAPVPDPAGPFIELLGNVAAHAPDVLVVARDTDPWAEALAGAARSAGREWGKVAKTVWIDDLGAVGQRVVAEWTNADRSADVRYAGGLRHVRGQSVVEPVAAWAPTASDVVLITGGTRGIGASLAGRIAAAGGRTLLVGRGAPSADAQKLIDAGSATWLRVDVTDRAALASACKGRGITAIVHAAGVLADGALGAVDPAAGALARKVKVDGWCNAIAAAGPTLKVALGIGSWAGRFGSRHQAHYAAGNAAMAAMAAHAPRGVRTVVGELGPWTDSEMAKTIPAPVQAAMRAEGVDFVGTEAGLSALWDDLVRQSGPVVHGRALPATNRAVRGTEVLSVQTHPFLADHAIDGTPILPLAGAADLLAWAAAASSRFELTDLRLYQGVTVREPTRITLVTRGDRAELRVGDREQLAYKAFVRPIDPATVVDPGPTGDGAEPTLPLEQFYGGITFHGPLFQGITRIDAVGSDFVRGRVKVGSPRVFVPGTARTTFHVDPLALDSAMQLSAYVAWIRYQRAGTPVGIQRWAQLRALPVDGLVTAEVRFRGEIDGDRFTGDVYLRDDAGTLLAVGEGVVAELRAVAGAPPPIKKEWIDPSTWPAVKDLEMRLQGAAMIGVRNPYFRVHQGTARDTTVVDGRELVNFSSYNYLGLSGDPRVLADVKVAVDRYGTSVSASRVASGERPFHQELEALLAESQGAEDALVFTAGHATNVTTIGHLFGSEDLILHDELIHDSALQGIKLSGAARRAFKHDDPKHLGKQLAELRGHYQKVLIAVEGVYSMDGDICRLPEYVALKDKYGCLLFVDEAHSFGIVGKTGRGVGEHHGIDGKRVDLWMGTLSKSVASCGGWIAGSKVLINYLRYTAPGFVYSAGLTPANGQAALSSLKLMLEEPWRVEKLQSNARFFHRELKARDLDTGPAAGESGVVPVVTGNSMHALVLSQRLVDQGINVQPIVYPAVADDAARLRFFLSSTHSEAQLAFTAQTVATTLAAVRAEFAL